jgi:hypothetical protein
MESNGIGGGLDVIGEISGDHTREISLLEKEILATVS